MEAERALKSKNHLLQAGLQKQARLRLELRDVDAKVIQLADDVLQAEVTAHQALEDFSAERGKPAALARAKESSLSGG